MTPEHLARQVERLCERRPDTRVVGVHAERWQGGDSIAVDGRTFPVHWCRIRPRAERTPRRAGRRRSAGRADAACRRGPQPRRPGPIGTVPSAPPRTMAVGTRRIRRGGRGPATADAAVDGRCTARRPATHRARSPTSVLDADAAWTHVLDHHLGLADGIPDAGAILRWSTDPGAVARFAALREPLAEAVRQEVRRNRGRSGCIACRTESRPDTRGELLPIGLVCDVLFSDDDDARNQVLADALNPVTRTGRGTNRASARRGERRVRARSRVGDGGAACPSGAAAEIGAAIGSGRAEVTLSNLKAEAFAERSSVLPSGLRSRLERFAAAATAAIDSRRTHWKRPRTHSAASGNTAPVPIGANARATLEMAMRLVRSLHRTRDTAGTAAGLMEHHATEGAFVDWARRRLLGGDEHPESRCALRCDTSRRA